MFQGIDLFSDTVTRPTLGMRKAMFDAEVGDEQHDEDPTTLKLEQKVARMLGRTAAVFFPSATMANEVAIRTLCDPGDELIAAESSHVFGAEAGGPAIHSGVMARPILTKSGVFTGEEVRRTYTWPKGPHFPISKLVCVENTTNMGGGVAWTRAQLDSVLNTARELSLKSHLDGARLFNASVRAGLSPENLASRFDTVTLCLSKGLGCPMGAVLAFDEQYTPKVRRLKQLMGGAMRQSGILAAAGIYALENHVSRLSEDHENARWFAEALSQKIPHLAVENNPPSTNMVFFQLKTSSLTGAHFLERCILLGLRFTQVGENRFRAVTHLDVKREDIQKAIGTLLKVCSEI